MEKCDQDESHAIQVPEERELHCKMIIIPWQISQLCIFFVKNICQSSGKRREFETHCTL
jgi:hypothetical protein